MHARNPSVNNSITKSDKHVQSFTNQKEPNIQNLRSIYPLNTNNKIEYTSSYGYKNTKLSSSYYSNDKQNSFGMLENELKSAFPYNDHPNTQKQVLSSTSSSYLSTSSSSSSSSLSNNLTSSISNPQIAKLNIAKFNTPSSLSPSSPSSTSNSSSSDSESPLFNDSNVKNSKKR